MWSICWFSVIVSLFIPTTVHTALPRISVHPDDGWLLDDLGRVRFFHGVNAVNKRPPWYWQDMLNPRYVDDLESWGMNIVRLGAMWPGAQPERDVVNQTYIDTIGDIVNMLEAKGIYTLFDMHQDCFDIEYEAIPYWVTQDFPPPDEPYPSPLEEITGWAECYLTEDVSDNFQGIYNNTDLAVEEWGNYWALMARNFRDQPAVLGYDLMNEPWVGDYLTDNGLLLPGVAGFQNLQPNYDILNDIIRQEDDNVILFYEPVTYGVLFNATMLGTGFTHVPGRRDYKNRSVLSYHMYCWTQDMGDNQTFCEDTLFPDIFATVEQDRTETGGGSMLTEFGMCHSSDQHYQTAPSCDIWTDLADEYLQSWIEWDYTNYHWYINADIDTPDYDTVRTFSRTYATAVAGTPTSMRFNSTTNYFSLIYTSSPSISAPTQIYVPVQLRYQDGFVVEVPAMAHFNVNGNTVDVFCDGCFAPTEIYVHIYPQ